MEERIIGAIAGAIHGEFPDVPILDAEAEQNVGRPAFFILSTGLEVTERITRAGFFATYSYDVLFDPGEGAAPEAVCRGVAETLAVALRRLPDPESKLAFRPFGLRFETVGGMLHALFKVRESLKVKTGRAPLIEDVAIKSRVKELRNEECRAGRRRARVPGVEPDGRRGVCGPQGRDSRHRQPGRGDD